MNFSLHRRESSGLCAWLLIALLICLAPLSARAETATLCTNGGYGDEFPAAYRPDDEAFKKAAKEFEQRMDKKILQSARPRHLAARSGAANLSVSLDAHARYFHALFAADGDIPRLCGTAKLAAEEATTPLPTMDGPNETQCRALKNADGLRARTIATLQKLEGDLRQKFGDPRNSRAGAESGQRYTQLSGAKKVNEDNLSSSGLPAAQLAALRQEAEQLWGKSLSDEHGLYSAAALQGTRELARIEALQKNIAEERAKLAENIGRCGSLGNSNQDRSGAGQAGPQRESGLGGETGNGTGVSDASAAGQSRGNPALPPPSAGSNSSFLSDNWPWLAGGAALVGGGAYVAHEYSARQADDAAAQANWNEQMALMAAQAHAGASTDTSTVTSTATSTGTDTETGEALFAPLKFTVQELEPIELSFSSDSAITLAGAPSGSSWEASTSTFRWIPKLGQAGSFTATLSSSKGKQAIELTVAARNVEELKNGGPPDHYRDGDVGYVFVHGAGGTVDRCAAGNDLAEYWGAAPNIVAPDENTRKLACYDGREDVASQAGRVAEQINNFDCGRFKKCILITHSMGGLLVEHMFTHTEAAPAGDKNAKFFEHAANYKKVRDKTLFVVSLASAAGGSKVADILISGKESTAMQKVSGFLARRVGGTNNAYKNLQAKYASETVAPITKDPGVPFFMVPGYSKKTLFEERGVFDIISLDVGVPNEKIFNTDSSCATLDYIAAFSSRSDGLVDFRSACGIADANPDKGPGYENLLPLHINYCAIGPKKPNHYPWFMINLNHYDIAMPTYHCSLKDNPCESMFYKNGAFTVDEAYAKKSAVEVLRDGLTKNRGGKKPVQLRTQLGI